MRLSEFEICLRNLAGRFSPERLGHMEKIDAHKKLIEMTGVDFGDDVEKWRAWGKEHPEITEIP